MDRSRYGKIYHNRQNHFQHCCLIMTNLLISSMRLFYVFYFRADWQVKQRVFVILVFIAVNKQCGFVIKISSSVTFGAKKISN